MPRRLKPIAFFVDTNTILSYEYGLGEIHRPPRTQVLLYEYSEAMEVKSPPRFVHIPGRINKEMEDFALQYLYEQWIRTFTDGRRFYVEEFQSYKDDLLMVMEAGYSQHDLLWDEPNIHLLLISNM